MRYALIFVVVLWAAMAQADDKHLLQLMDVETEVRDMMAESYKKADKKVRRVVMQTTLWKRYMAARTTFNDHMKVGGKCGLISGHYKDPWTLTPEHIYRRLCPVRGRAEYYRMKKLYEQVDDLRRNHTNKLYREDARAKLNVLKKGAEARIQELLEKKFGEKIDQTL